MANKDKIEVTLTSTWVISKKDWNDSLPFMQAMADIKDKAEFDHQDVFWHLSQTGKPDWKVNVKKVTEN